MSGSVLRTYGANERGRGDTDLLRERRRTTTKAVVSASEEEEVVFENKVFRINK